MSLRSLLLVLGAFGSTPLVHACAKPSATSSSSAAPAVASAGPTGASTATAPAAAEIPQTIAVSGKVALAPGAGSGVAPGLLTDHPVELQDSAGKSIATGVSDANGNFTILVPGQVALSTGPGLLEGANNFQIVSVIEDDGTGKVLGVRQPISLTKDKVKNGAADVGNFNFSEIAAIKGTIKFVNPDGTENTKLAKIGTDVYLPGFSLGAKADRDGRFLILYVPPATYTLRIEKGSLSTESSVTVVANKTLNLGTLPLQTDTVPPITTVSKDSTDFRNPLCVTLTATKAGSSTYYTVDGSTPTATPPFLYNPAATTACGATAACPICVAGVSTTLKYFSVDSIGNAENQATRFYFYNDKWADPSDKSPPVTTMLVNNVPMAATALYLTAAATVSFSVSEGAYTYYTTDGSAPTSTSALYSTPFVVNATATVKYFSKDWAANVEAVNAKDLKVYDWFKVNYTAALTPPNFRDIVYDKSQQKLIAVAKSAQGNCSALAATVDTWIYSGTTWTKTAGGPSVGDAALAYDSDNQKVYMFVIPACNGGSATQTYTFNYGNNTWTNLGAGLGAPGQSVTASTAAAYDQSTQTILVNYSIITSGDNYWSVFTPAGPSYGGTTTMSGRNFMHLAYDSQRQRTVAFGTAINGTGTTVVPANNGLVYEFYGSAWHDVATNQIPSVENFVYDEARQVMTGFGGGYGSGVAQTANAETWQYDGVDWTMLPPQHSPKPRYSAAHVYDSANKKLIIYGGFDRFGGALSDMWEYRY